MQNRKAMNEVKENYWQPIIKDWQTSRLSAAAYCRQHGLGEAQFSHWKRKLFPELTPQKPLSHLPAFAEVVVVEDSSLKIPPKIENIAIEMTTPTGYSIKLYPGFNEACFKKIIQLVEVKLC